MLDFLKARFRFSDDYRFYSIRHPGPQVAQARRASSLLRNIQNIRICMGKNLSFLLSVTYENKRISIKKNSLPYLKCVLRFSCVVHGSIYGCFMGFYVNGFLSI